MTLRRDPEENETRYLHAVAHLAGKRVLEIGCGEGRLTWRYAHTAARVIGIDLDPARLRVAQRECPPEVRPKLSFSLADSQALPFPDEAFDAAILAWSL
jgi:ubiquinone/menaquinone biosynthesis C-methylase UbiE